MDRLAKINAYADRRDNELAKAKQAKEEHIKKMLATVKSWAPRIKELMATFNALVDRNVKLPASSSYMDITPDFITNGWSHHVGFIARYSCFSGHLEPARGVGKAGGGACYDDVFFNEDGVPTKFHPDGMVIGVNAPMHDGNIRNLEDFVSGFEEFEKRFYAFVDSL